ncbi:hypothetical protein AB0F88_24580 [Streptosporangium sp. NPDC023963]|uniref:hypothetical protein n=1 Tax=Streptosporangium sp. NPDC023963 TaxID=3155608 RepID=UPI0034369AEA
MLTWKNAPTGRRSWAWFAVAVSASLAPWALLATTEGGGSAPPLPLMMIAISLAGASARNLIVLDVFVIGVLPLLVGVVAVARSRMLVSVTSGICGILALLHLVPLLERLPITLPPANATADMFAGSQPDFYFGTHPEGGVWALAPIAYAVSAVALLVAARRRARGVTRD